MVTQLLSLSNHLPDSFFFPGASLSNRVWCFQICLVYLAPIGVQYILVETMIDYGQLSLTVASYWYKCVNFGIVSSFSCFKLRYFFAVSHTSPDFKFPLPQGINSPFSMNWEAGANCFLLKAVHTYGKDWDSVSTALQTISKTFLRDEKPQDLSKQVQNFHVILDFCRVVPCSIII